MQAPALVRMPPLICPAIASQTVPSPPRLQNSGGILRNTEDRRGELEARKPLRLKLLSPEVARHQLVRKTLD
mgnify:CR=1